MAYSAIAVANAFIEKAKERRISDLTPMKLQKLVYFAHAWSLAAGNEPLINDQVKAWKFGPVIDSIYQEFKSYGSNNITKLGTEFFYEDDGERLIRSRFVAPTVPKTDKMANAIIDTILEVYGDKSAYYLSNLTHEKGSAWAVTREHHQDGENKGFVIPDAIIGETTKKELGIE
ncbi:Panacea domain-containing protein [Rouxiella sp. WC2420]|uniref:Panacea domain-containing protein n=1 Tax=Rouxiella sp. WC2420 TaxID=3234145 RepID=A0AB39VMA1_9GAMM